MMTLEEIRKILDRLATKRTRQETSLKETLREIEAWEILRDSKRAAEEGKKK